MCVFEERSLCVWSAASGAWSSLLTLAEGADAVQLWLIVAKSSDF